MRPRQDMSDLDMFMAQPTRFQICFFVGEFSTLFFELGGSRWTLGGFGRVGEDFSDIFFSSHSLGVFLSLLKEPLDSKEPVFISYFSDEENTLVLFGF